MIYRYLQLQNGNSPALDEVLARCRAADIVVDVVVFGVQDVEAGPDLLIPAAMNAMRTVNFQLGTDNPLSYFNVTGQPSFTPITVAAFDGSPYPGRDGAVTVLHPCFQYAVKSPPYPIRDEGLYDELTRVLFDGFEDRIECFKGSDDWSDYFDAGREWWGTFCWAVVNHTKQTIIVILGSATD